MSRLAAAARNDVRLQWRQGFWAAAGFVAVFATVGLRYVPHDLRLILLPPVILSNLAVGTFYFVAALVLLERAEGSLDALAVSPLRDREYTLAKVGSLALLALAEHLAVVMVGHGTDFAPGALLIGVVMAAATYVLLGLISVLPYDSMNTYLMPSMVWIAVLSLPYLHYFELVPGPLRAALWLHPLQPSLSWLRAAFRGGDPLEAVYASVCGAAWIALLWRRCRSDLARRGVAPGDAGA